MEVTLADAHSERDITLDRAGVAGPNPASSAKQPSPAEELQQAISKAGNDRAALVRVKGR